MEISIVRGLGAAEEAIKVIKEQKPLCYITSVNVIEKNYYFCNWLITSGYYVWNDKTNLFEPNVKNIPKDDVLRINSGFVPAGKRGSPYMVSSVFGSCAYALYDKCFTQCNAVYDVYDAQGGKLVVFSSPLRGTDADFLYIKLNTDTGKPVAMIERPEGWAFDYEKTSVFQHIVYSPFTNVTVSWTGQNNDIQNFSNSLGRGELLIPLGTDVDWLMNEHGDMFIGISENGKQIECDIADMRLLKLRNIE